MAKNNRITDFTAKHTSGYENFKRTCSAEIYQFTFIDLKWINQQGASTTRQVDIQSTHATS